MKSDGKNRKQSSDGKNISPPSHSSHPILPPRGDYQTLLSYQKAEVIANIAICLIHQANYLLDQQLRRLEQDFLKEGGLRERMTRARLATRSKQQREGVPHGK